MSLTTSTVGNLLAEVHMILLTRNSLAINQFFLSWWTAVGNAASTASLNLGQIVQLLDPIDDTNAIVNDVYVLPESSCPLPGISVCP